MTIRRLFIAACLLLLSACEKTTTLATDAYPELVGNWLHHPHAGTNVRLFFYDNGYGFKRYDGAEDYWDESKDRKWYFANDKLFFGKHRVKTKADGNYIFRLETCPTVASHDFILYFDTVAAGDTYMMLGGRVYRKQ